MVRIRTDLPDTSSRREDAPQWRVPLGSYPDRQCRHPSSAGKARLAVHHRSACSGVKALPNTSHARRQAAKLCYRFGPLTPSARSANLIAGDGTKNGLPAPNKELTANPKQPLDRKSPIQVACEPEPGAAEIDRPPYRDSRSPVRAVIGCLRMGHRPLRVHIE